MVADLVHLRSRVNAKSALEKEALDRLVCFLGKTVNVDKPVLQNMVHPTMPTVRIRREVGAIVDSSVSYKTRRMSKCHSNVHWGTEQTGSIGKHDNNDNDKVDGGASGSDKPPIKGHDSISEKSKYTND
ncbi:hypothetical protein J6590_049998 [Homalodisca vitripennis]|nr:hypothetical protein J6590_049998 [Homalodisca vitripennis]